MNQILRGQEVSNMNISNSQVYWKFSHNSSSPMDFRGNCDV